MSTLSQSVLYTPTHRVVTAKDNYIESQYADEPAVIQVSSTRDSTTYFVRFRSPHGPVDFPDCGERFDNSANRTFMAKLYAPRDRANRAAILYNGLDETVFTSQLDEAGLFGFYDDLGTYLASHNVLTILLPTPYHMNRALSYLNPHEEQRIRDGAKRTSHKTGKYVDYTVPTNALIRNPSNIYKNHYYGFKETMALCRCLVRTPKSPIFPDVDLPGSPVSEEVLDILGAKLTAAPQISLIGYSLGGLRALTEFIHDQRIALANRTPSVFSACVAINSGGALSDLRAPLWVDPDSWQGMLNRLILTSATDDRLADISTEERSVADRYFSVLEDVFLGRARSLAVLEAGGVHAVTKCLFILGGADELIGLDNLSRFEPAGGVNVLQVARVGHMFRYGAWGRWKDTVCNLVSDFIATTCESEQEVEPKVLAEFVALLDHALGILPYLDDLESKAALDRAKSELQTVIPASLATKVLGDSTVQLIKDRLGGHQLDRLDEEFAKYAAKLVRRLERLIKDRNCHPGIYRTTRRSLLFGWHVLHDRDFVDAWQMLASRARAKGMKIGDLLRQEQGVPASRVDQAERTHDEAMTRVRLAMAMDFCKERL